MESFTIGEVARRTGLRPSALRYYEQRGLLAVPERVNGQRRYRPEVVARIAILRFAQRAGFTLAEMRQLLPACGADTAPPEAWQQQAQQKLQALDRQIAQLQTMRQTVVRSLTCPCVDLEHCTLVQGQASIAFG